MFHPHLVLGIGSQVVQSGDVEFQFVRLGEFTKTSAHANQLFVTKAFGKFQYLFGDVIDAIQMFAEAIGTIRAINQLFDIGANAVGIEISPY